MSEVDKYAEKLKNEYIDRYFFLNDNKSQISNDFQILTSIRYDPGLLNQDDFETSMFFLFEEHFKRLQFELEFFEWNEFELTREQLLGKLGEVVNEIYKTDPSGAIVSAYKLRVTIDRDGKVKITASKARERTNLLDGLGINISDDFAQTPPIVYGIYIDSQSTPMSCFTSFKTTNRAHYSAARQRKLSNPDNYAEQDVLLYNDQFQITECTISNVAFRRIKQDADGTMSEVWATPPISSGCLCGVVRQMLISRGFIEEQQVMLDEVKLGDQILYFNAVIGVCHGVIVQ